MNQKEENFVMSLIRERLSKANVIVNLVVTNYIINNAPVNNVNCAGKQGRHGS
jgi:hypothetical protein